MALATPAQTEDPSDRLYAISVELEYKLLESGRVLSTGKGQTKLMSSSRVVFESENPLPPGVLAELNLTWPVRLAENIGLLLNVFGRTVLATGNSVTMDILRHEFQRVTVPVTKAMAAGSSITAYGPPQD